jgi:chromatin remodeling complex protein RSC6
MTTVSKPDTVPTQVKTDVEMQEIASEFSELESTIQSLTLTLITMGKRMKKLEKNIGVLVKARSKKVKTHKKEVPAPISAALMTFMGLTEPLATRSDALRKISDYVRKSGLQLEEDKRTFETDKVLSELFNISVGHKLTFLAINKYVTPLFLTDSKKTVAEVPAKVSVKAEKSTSDVAAPVPKKKVVKKTK